MEYYEGYLVKADSVQRTLGRSSSRKKHGRSSEKEMRKQLDEMRRRLEQVEMKYKKEEA